MLLALFVEDIDGIRNLFKAAIICPIPYDIVLYYHTEFNFFGFLILYHTHTQYVGEMYVVMKSVRLWEGMRCGRCSRVKKMYVESI
jgi:hypothetical protein